MFSRDIWIPFFEPALLAFPAWSQISLALFSFWNAVMGVLLVIPTCIVINKYGKYNKTYVEFSVQFVQLQVKRIGEACYFTIFLAFKQFKSIKVG